MVRSDSSLQRVVIEDVSPVDRVGASRRAFLAADITEYYEGEHFDDATKVVISQLKYSHRNPNKPWTAARLAPKGQARERTILGKLVDAYREYMKKHHRDEVLKKLTVRLVSNMPGNPTLLRLVRECQARLNSRPLPTLNRTVTQSLDGQLMKNYQLLFERSGLTQREFTDFLRVLDLDYLGTADRFGQENRIVTTLAGHVLGNAFSAVRSLYDLVRKAALPEASESLGISQADVLAELGVTGWSDLLPLPARVESPQFLVQQSDARHLAELISAEGGRHIVAYGDAGVGKTTSLLQLEATMPGDSVVVLYDCFAGGEYLDPAERRHVPKYAVRQLINEIALKCGTPLLFTDNSEDLLLWRRLKEVLGAVGRSLAEHGGHLVIVIDAADNAVVASHVYQGDPCFVPELWRLTLPENVHLVMSCRTARRRLLDAPEHAHSIELVGFDESGSTDHLRHHFPRATSAECITFHANSNGNPRLQSYVLDPQRSDRPETPAGCADEASTTIGAVFDDLLDTAVHSRLHAGDSQEWLAVLMALDRPIRMESLRLVLDASEDEVNRFCRGLVPGVRIEADAIVLRDEDFETHLRSRCAEHEVLDAHGRIADCYLTLKGHHGWAAQAVAGHLYSAGRAEQLIALALKDRELAAISDPLVRNQVYLYRIKLALRIATSADRSVSLKLLVLAAAMKRADSAVTALIREKPELAMQYADSVAVARVYETAGNDAWKGPLHMRVAASSARHDDRDAARVQLKLAHAWLRRWSDLDEQVRRSWRLDADDAAAAAEARFYLDGPDAAALEIRRWRPAKFALQVAERLIARIAGGPRRIDLADHVANQELPIDIEAQLLAVLFRYGGSASSSQLERVCRGLIERPLAAMPERDHSWRLELIESAASVVGDDVLLDLIETLRPMSPDYVSDIDLDEWEIPLRLACLESIIANTTLEVENILPEHLKRFTEADSDRHETRQHEKDRKKLLKWLRDASDMYLLRASCVSGRKSPGDAVTESLKLLEPFAKQSRHRYIEYAWIRRFERTTLAVIDSLCFVDADLTDLYDLLMTIAPGSSAPLATWLDLAETMLRRRTYISWAEKLIDHVVRETQELNEPPQVKAERLLRCAALMDSTDQVQAADYYSEAIDASLGLDEDRARVLDLMNHLADPLPEHRHQEAAALAPRLQRAVEQFRPFVHDPSGLPWTKTIETMTALHPDSGIRALTLWDECGDLPIELGVVAMSKALTAQETIDVITAVQLLWLMSESHGCTRHALDMLDRALEAQISRSALISAVGWLGERIARHMTLDVRLSEAATFADWIEMNGFEDAPWATKILTIRDMAKVQPDTGPPATPSRAWYHAVDHDRQGRIADLIALASSDRPADLEDRLEQLAEEWATSDQVGQYLTEFGTRIAPHMRIRALEAICDLHPDGKAWRRNSHPIVLGLAHWLSVWSATSSVRNWSRRNLPNFFLDRYPSIVGFDYQDDATLATYLSIDTLDDPVGLLLEATSRHLEVLSPQQVILLSTSLSDDMRSEDRIDGLKWILDEFLEDAHDTQASSSATTSELLLSDLVWALLGHPDKIVRWRAMHFALDVSKRSSVFVEHLVGHFDDQTGLGFFAKTSTFLWMSAQVWTLVGLRRLAIDEPEIVGRYIELIHDTAVSSTWPHALLRELARCILLELPWTTLATANIDPKEIAFTNRPSACQIDRQGPISYDRHSRDVRFHFDSLDTVPYWFEPLARVFGIGTREIENRADRWIAGLGHTNETVRNDRPQLRHRFDYHHINNDHGSEPRVEDLQTYLEWHAMFLVAGQLVDSGTPSIVKDYGTPEDQWSAWLSQYLDFESGLWTSDYRDPVPAWSRLHIPANRARDTWRVLSDADFDRQVLIDDAAIVSASTEASNGILNESTTVKSALVSPESGYSLLISLQDLSNHRYYALPSEHDDDRHQIDETGFKLLGWLIDINRERAGLDEHDPVARIRRDLSIPGIAFQEATKNSYSLQEWQSNAHALQGPVKLRRWSDKPINLRAHSRPSYTEGRQTLVRLPELISFLRSVGKDLILESIISRNFESRYAGLEDDDTEDQYDTGTARIYLLRRDRSISDGMGRHFRTG